MDLHLATRKFRSEEENFYDKSDIRVRAETVVCVCIHSSSSSMDDDLVATHVVDELTTFGSEFKNVAIWYLST